MIRAVEEMDRMVLDGRDKREHGGLVHAGTGEPLEAEQRIRRGVRPAGHERLDVLGWAGKS